MEETYFYSRNRRIPVFRLRSAQVVRLPEGRDFVSIPGWRSIPLGNSRFQLLVRADVIPERALQVHRLEALVENLLEAERTIDQQPSSKEEESLREELGAQSAPALIGQQGGLFLPTGEIVVKFRPNLEIHSIEREVQERGGTVVRPISFLPHTFLLQPIAGGDGLELASRLVEASLVEFASPNFIEEMPWRAKEPPPNEYFTQQWHLHNVGQNGTRPGADVRALEAWEITTGSPDIIICIIDSGIDSRHEAFSARGKLVPGFDFEDDDVLPDPTTSSHGTSCAGVAAAPWGIGRAVGIAPDCRIMPIRRAILSEHLKMAEAFVWAADHGADVISCSFGYDNRPWILPDVVREAINQAVNEGRNGRGCVVVWAAGNGNELISTDEWASDEKVIAVAASTDQDVRAPYSDFGAEVDVCAPSSGGRNGITTKSNGGYTNLFGGTSSAAPLVAGIAALLLSVNPNLTWREVRDLLGQSADTIDLQRGNYDSNGHSDWYGYGRVNALKALHAISTLAEAARDSDVEPRLSLIRQFADQLLVPRPAGRQILQFLERRKFRILELLKSNPSFRQNTVTVLRATADAYEAIQRGRNLMITDATWEAVAALGRLLLPEVSAHREEESLERRNTIMAERSSRYSPEREQESTTPERPTENINDVINRLAEILGRRSSSERDEPVTPRPLPSSGLSLEEFIETAAKAVLRAIDARNLQASDERNSQADALSKLAMPSILVGFIALPESRPGEVMGRQPSASTTRELRAERSQH